MAATLVPARDRARALEMLRGVEPHAVDGASAADMARGCAVLEAIEDGQAVGAVAVDLVHGVATITAAWSTGIATYAELGELEQACRRAGARRMRVLTRRPGLIRTLIREGYAVAQCELNKDL